MHESAVEGIQMELFLLALGAAFGAIVGVFADRGLAAYRRRRSVTIVHQRTASRRAMGHAMGDSMRRYPLYEDRERIEIACGRCGTKPVVRFLEIHGLYRCELCEYEWYWKPSRKEHPPTLRKFIRWTKETHPHAPSIYLHILCREGIRSAISFYHERRSEFRSTYESVFEMDPKLWEDD